MRSGKIRNVKKTILISDPLDSIEGARAGKNPD